MRIRDPSTLLRDPHPLLSILPNSTVTKNQLPLVGNRISVIGGRLPTSTVTVGSDFYYYEFETENRCPSRHRGVQETSWD